MMKKDCTHSPNWKTAKQRSLHTQQIQKAKRIRIYNRNPKKCRNCKRPIPYKLVVGAPNRIFCSKSCSAKHYNAKRKKIFICTHCTASFTKVGGGHYRFCSRKCSALFRQAETRKKIERGDGADTHTLRQYILATRPYQCVVCLSTTWQGQPIPLVVDHKDGNPFNHKLENLRLVCNNCDSLSTTFKARNRGKGRVLGRLKT